MMYLKKILTTVLFILTLLIPVVGFAITPEGVIEEICDAVDVADCSFDDYSALYNFGKTTLTGGAGKIRSNAAYCLIRDGQDAVADGTFGEEGDWTHFGTKSKFHLTYAGKDSDNIYRASGQRLLTFVLFDHELPNLEIQDLSARFPNEKKYTVKSSCKKKGKFKNTCVGSMAIAETNYYLDLDTESYSWELDLATILSEVFGLNWPGLELTVGQDVAFNYAGVTVLSGADTDLNNGIFPALAGAPNSWEWGLDPDYDQPTTYLNAKFPVASAWAAQINLLLELGLNGFYKLLEGNNATGSPDFSAADPDGFYGGTSGTSTTEAGLTMTELAAKFGIEFVAQVCIDFRWFGTYCGEFPIIDFASVEDLEPLNFVTYEANGSPLYLQWADGTSATGADAVHAEITECLSAETIVNPPEEMADPTDIVDFLRDVGGSFVDHFHVCEKNSPPAPTVSYTDPTFKLCDNEGHVYEAINGIYPKED